MTGLYVICSKRPQAHLSRRRQGYREYVLGDTYAYAREAIAPDDLGRREEAGIRMLPRWREDIASVADAPEASFFFVEMTPRESPEEAIARGLALPLSRDTGPVLLAGGERRAALRG